MKSLAQMITQVEGLHDTGDLTDWENEFVGSLIESDAKSDTTQMSPRQVEQVGRIYRAHFA